MFSRIPGHCESSIGEPLRTWWACLRKDGCSWFYVHSPMIKQTCSGQGSSFTGLCFISFNQWYCVFLHTSSNSAPKTRVHCMNTTTFFFSFSPLLFLIMHLPCDTSHMHLTSNPCITLAIPVSCVWVSVTKNASA